MARNKRTNKPYTTPHGPVNLIYSKPGFTPVIVEPGSTTGRLAFQMRSKCPSSERRFREALKRFEKDGVYFQHSVAMLGYIPDFYCAERKLIIEIDGPHHKYQQSHDNRRDAAFRRIGIRTFRVLAWRVFYQLEELMEDIAAVLTYNPPKQIGDF